MASLSRNAMAAGELPTSATVLDFICLFTHDLKRKQKRWQDGQLKYHTFNKRIMVYDDRNHFIGDAHWQSDGHLAEGDEFELDRGGAIVQVSECIGQREQDLTELIDKRAKDVEQRRANAASRTPRQSGMAVRPVRQDESLHFQMRHRPLSSVVGTPSRIGRAAIPQRSPYEARQMAQTSERMSELEDSRPSKRARRERSPSSKSSHARSLFGATLSLSAQPLSTPIFRTQASQSQPNVEVEVQAARSKAASRIQKHAPPNQSPQATHCRTTNTKEAVKEPLILEKSTRAPPKSTHQSHVEDVVVLSDEETAPGILMQAPTSSQLIERRPPLDAQVRRNTLTDKPEPNKNALGPRRKANTSDSPKMHPSSHHGTCENLINDIEREQTKKASIVQETAEDITGEPRTELRIRSRQRRGLLMMSEKNVRNKANGAYDSVSDDKDPSDNQEQGPSNPLIRSRVEPLVTTDSPRTRPLSPPLETADATGLSDTDIEIVEPLPVGDGTNKVPLLSVGKGIDNTTSNYRSDCESSEDEESVCPPISRPMRKNDMLRKRTRCVISDDESESTERDSSAGPQKSNKSHRSNQRSSKGPRITRMARKSVKSREIIGFVVPSDEPVFANTVSIGSKHPGESHHQDTNQTDAQPSLPMDGAHNAPVEMNGSKKAELATKSASIIDRSDSMPRPKLSNPATRGRKAARKGDAAGQPPRTIVQFETGASRCTSASTAAAPEPRTSLPGFVRANGGAWSRHAEDLLGMTRPTAKAAR